MPAAEKINPMKEAVPTATRTGSLCYQLNWSARNTLGDRLRDYPLVHILAPGLEPAEFIGLAGEIGSAETGRRLNCQLDGYPEIMLFGNIRNEAGERISGSALRQGWHSDMSYRQQPPEYTMLYALEVPERGGDTHFSSLYRLHQDFEQEARKDWGQVRSET